MSYITNQNNLSSSSNTNNKNNSYFDDSKYSSMQRDVSIERTIYKFKVILLGNSCVGKTSILNRFIGKQFSSTYKCTVGVEFKIKSILLDPYTSSELKIWDTCGEEKFKSITRQYYKDANGVILLYDLSDKKTFDSLNNWLKEIRNNAPKYCSIIVVGNKADLERKVSNDDAMTFAKNENVSYLEVSAKNGINIELIFEKLSKEMVIKSKEIEDENNNKNTINNKSGKIMLNNGNITNGEKSYEVRKEKEVSCC